MTQEDLFDQPAAKKSPGKSAAKKTAKAKTKAAEKKPAAKTRGRKSSAKNSYSAKDIEVLEGLEPVRRRPGMYIGGTDERAMQHLVAELLDNAMDEAVAGEASRIDLELRADQTVSVRDNGRGIPVDPHPKFKDRSALEIILTTLHSGGKFGGSAYAVSGGLHGVGLSVVNALSDELSVHVARDGRLWSQAYQRGQPTGKLKSRAGPHNRRGTTITFHPDAKIFGAKTHFRPAALYRLARSKAYLFRGVEIRWSCDPLLITGSDETPAKDNLHFPGGLNDFLASSLAERATLTANSFAGEARLNGKGGSVEWAIAWPEDEDGFLNSYCNTVPTHEGGTHEAGLRAALAKGLKGYGELVNNRQAAKITADDVIGGACGMLSLFIHDPLFQGQTKERLSSPEATRMIEASVGDHFDHWLSGDPQAAGVLLERILERTDARLKRRQAKELKRQSATRRLRLPGKLADCTRNTAEGTEVFLVEGDSAGGSAKQGRDRATQAILPLRGKILNVASASADKLAANQEIRDLCEALGCGTGAGYVEENLRYERVIIMTDADVDGAHIASLLMTYFFKKMQQLIVNGHLFLALPPLYRLSRGAETAYAMDEVHRDKLLETTFGGRGKVEISRFKGLGEMPPAQLKETAMDPATRTLLRVTLPHGQSDDDKQEARDTEKLVEDLMGRKPELRLAFIQEHAREVETGDIDL